MKRLTFVPIFVALSLLLSSCSMHLGLSKLLPGGSGGNGNLGAATVKATHTPPAPVTALSIKNGKFHPKNVTVKLGTTLTWTNNDDVQESVTSDTPGVFDSGLLQPGATWKYTFSQPGVFPYHSTGQDGVFGSVTVTH
jgi:plastocyanin